LERKNLWAPWRIGYIQHLTESSDCFICHNLANPQDDNENLVLWRSGCCIVILNRFPYNNGHLLIAPARHIADLDQATDEELLEMTKLVRESQKALSLAIKPHGFNVGMNFGRCAGAGLCSDTKVVSQSLSELLEQLKQISKEHNLPRL
jgi:ATP adenylyltransferase